MVEQANGRLGEHEGHGYVTRDGKVNNTSCSFTQRLADCRGKWAHQWHSPGLATTGPMGTAMLTIMAAFAQLERDTMIERIRAGLAAAAVNNRHGGRPRKIDDAAAARAKKLK